MSLAFTWRALLRLAGPQAAAASQRAAPWMHTTAPRSAAAAVHTSSAASAGQQPPDPFTQSLQSKTEAELLELIQRRLAEQQRAAAGGDAAEGGSDADEDDVVSIVNPETGEIGGPKGKEPTRFGDWERGGKAIDF